MQMLNNRRTLVFFTDTFPCGSGETFIENEISYLSGAFEQVYIVTNNMKDEVTRPIPTNVKVARYPYTATRDNKIRAVTQYFNHILKAERQFCKQKGIALNRQVLTTMLATYAKMHETEALLQMLIKQEEIDLSNLYLYAYWMNDMAASIALFKKNHPQVKAFCRAHRWDIYMGKQPNGYLPFRQFIIENLSCCYPISNDAVQYLNNLTNNQYPHKLKTARLGTLNSNYQLSPEGNADELVLLSCSNVIERKRVHLIIEALALLSNVRIKWIHIGGGALYDEVKALAEKKLSGNSHVSFEMNGPMDNRDIIAYYANNPVDLFINVSESEGVPVSIMEANSYGIPAIATNTGGVAEMMDSSNGFLLDVNCTPQIIANTIKQYANLSASEKQQYKANAFGTWNTLYNAEKNYTAFVGGVINL